MKAYLASLLLSGLVILSACKKNDDDNLPSEPEPANGHCVVEVTKSLPDWLNNHEYHQSLIFTSGGGVAVFYSYYNNDASGTRLMKFSNALAEEFSKTYSSSEFGSDNAAIIQTSDGGFLLAGGIPSAFVGKTDVSGNLIWREAVGYHGIRQVYALSEKPSGGYVLLAGGQQLYLVDMDAQGDTLSCRNIDSALANPKGVAVHALSDQDVLLVYNAKAGGDFQSYVAKLSLVSGMQWCTEFSSPGSNMLLNGLIVNDGSHYITYGYKFNPSNQIANALIARIGTDGSKIWEAVMNDRNYQICGLSEGGDGSFTAVTSSVKSISQYNATASFEWDAALEENVVVPPEGFQIIRSGNTCYIFYGHFDLNAMKTSPVLAKIQIQ